MDSQKLTGFQHSKPVPRLYKEAKSILKNYEDKRGALKNLVFNGKYKNYSAIYGLLCKCVDNDTVIQKVLKEANLFEEQPRFDPLLARILTTELIFKEGELKGECRPIQTILQYKTKILSIARSALSHKGLSEKKKGLIPRYVRINTLLSSSEDVHAHLQRDGWELKKYERESLSYKEYLNIIKNLDGKSYFEDYHLSDLLVFPPDTPFWESNLLKENAIVLQDKASCLPPFLSGIRPGSKAIDACAAPGNKTSYIAALIKNKGTVFAIEKDSKRYNTLNQMVTSRGATCVKTQLNDFTKLDPQKYKKVTHIFLDPSCSSTGMNIHNDEVSSERLSSLASFQLNLLNHALSFPNVQMVIYSTCSVHTQENEEVVQKALLNYQHTFDLEDLSQLMSGWTNLGYNDKFSLGSHCLRTISEEDLCHGFFVAKFVKKVSDDNELSYKKEKKKTNEKYENFTHSIEESIEDNDVARQITNDNIKKKKKKRSLLTEVNEDQLTDSIVCNDDSNYVPKKKKKKKKDENLKQSIEESIEDNDVAGQILKDNIKKKKKKRSHLTEVNEDQVTESIVCNDDSNYVPKKKKKKKKKEVDT